MIETQWAALRPRSLQRAANQEIEGNGFKDSMDQVVLDVLLSARGVPWVRFEADKTPEGGVTNERVMVDYVHWDDFAHCAREELGGRRAPGLGGAENVAPARPRAKSALGKSLIVFPMTMPSRMSETTSQSQREGSANRYAEVWEIWDMVSKRRIFVAKGAEDVLESKDPQYEA